MNEMNGWMPTQQSFSLLTVDPKTIAFHLFGYLNEINNLFQ